MVLEKNVKNKMDTITNDKVFQRAKEERLLLKILENRCHSWIGHTIRHNEFVVNILEGAISRKKVSTTILKASHQKHRS
jgi:porphobilinogen deaminase